MSNTQNDPTAGTGAPGGQWWTKRPRRSTNDRKVAGVAGGLGRAFGVDPVLIRVGFVVLAVLGGFGGLLYVLGWLLLPADGDEVSAAESLIGRGRSSTPPALAVGLAIVAMFSLASMFSWGLPFWPLVIGAIIVFSVARKRGQGCSGHNRANADEWATRMTAKSQSWGAQAEQWVTRQPWSGTPGMTPPPSDSASSPFDEPAFWDDNGRGPGVSMTKEQPDTPTGAARQQPQQPPAWDPLGVAPFAWDLPEPTPLPPPAAAPRQRSVVGRVTMGAVLIVGGLATAGIFAGWWQLTWAGVAATALAVVALGLLIGSIRGRGQALIGPGIFLSVLTLGLAVTGIDGTTGYGQQTWTPTTVAAAAEQSPFLLNGGQGILDLSGLTVPAGQTADIDVEVRAGEALVTVPADATVTVTCTANAGQVDCLGVQSDGLQQEVTREQVGSNDEGRINLTVHVGAGHAEVRNG